MPSMPACPRCRWVDAREWSHCPQCGVAPDWSVPKEPPPSDDTAFLGVVLLVGAVVFVLMIAVSLG